MFTNVVSITHTHKPYNFGHAFNQPSVSCFCLCTYEKESVFVQLIWVAIQKLQWWKVKSLSIYTMLLIHYVQMQVYSLSSHIINIYIVECFVLKLIFREKNALCSYQQWHLCWVALISRLVRSLEIRTLYWKKRKISYSRATSTCNLNFCHAIFLCPHAR